MKKLFYKHGESWRCDDGSIGSRNTVSLAQNFRIEEGDEQVEGEIESKKFSKRVFRDVGRLFSYCDVFIQTQRFPHCCALNSRYRLFTYESTMHARMHEATLLRNRERIIGSTTRKSRSAYRIEPRWREAASPFAHPLCGSYRGMSSCREDKDIDD